jgi:ribosomal protein S18 acetylase RimI-like enzyme
VTELVFRESYWADLAAKEAFRRFLVEVHGLDLSAWESAGYWNDDHYGAYSYFDSEGRVVSSVCVYSLKMVVDGSACRAAQISGVGTLPEYRRQGLNRRLTEIALERVASDHDFVFLFSDPDAIPFYRRCGFQPVEESLPYVEVDPRVAKPGMRLLDLENPAHRSQVERMAAARTPVSETLGVLSPELFMFHALYQFSGRLHHLPDLDVVVAFRRDGTKLTVYDIVGPRLPRFNELYAYMASPGTTEIDFYFVPDKLAIETLRWRPLPDNHLFDRGEFPLRSERFVFPFTAHA